MKLRIHTLWKVPVYCIVASIVSFFLIVYLGGPFFTVTSVGADGITELSADPVRTAVFNSVIFAAVLLAGGLWAFRSMSKLEIAVSAAIISSAYLIIVLAQLYATDFPLSWSAAFAVLQSWSSISASFLIKLSVPLKLSAFLSIFSPFLFVPFGKKSTK